LTTYRKLAEHALDKLAPYYSNPGKAWTASAVLPGGDISGSREKFALKLSQEYPFISQSLAQRLTRTYGSKSRDVLGKATKTDDLGEHFGHEFYDAELRYLIDNEWVRTQEDALWRRTKLGMWLSDEEQSRIGARIKAYRSSTNG